MRYQKINIEKQDYFKALSFGGTPTNLKSALTNLGLFDELTKRTKNRINSNIKAGKSQKLMVWVQWSYLKKEQKATLKKVLPKLFKERH